MSDPITFTIEKIGTVTMKGEGPWRVQSFNQHDRNIVDKDGRDANPTVKKGFRPASNVVFAKTGDAEKVVAKANELFGAQAA